MLYWTYIKTQVKNLNNNKTEILMIGSATSVKRMDLSFEIDGVHVKPSSSLSVILVSYLTHLYISHISSVVKTSFFHLRNIAHLRTSLTLTDAEILIHELITSRLDYCNALFLGLPKKLLTFNCKVTVCSKLSSKSSYLHQVFCSHYSSTAWSSVMA